MLLQESVLHLALQPHQLIYWLALNLALSTSFPQPAALKIHELSTPFGCFAKPGNL